MKLILVLNIFLSVLTLVSYKGETTDAANHLLLRRSSNSVLAHPVTESESDWSVIATSVKPSQDLVDVHMLDSNFGKAVGNKGTIFETMDGGQSWQPLPGGLPNPDFVRISFFSKSVGGAVITRSRSLPGGQRLQYDAYLLRTEDGGRSWTTQYKVRNGTLNEVTVVNDREGWAVGSRWQGKNDETEKILVLHTVDQGRRWSESFNRSSEADDSAEDVFSEAPSKATVLTGNGAILVTEDAGRSWRRLKTPESDKPQLVNLRLLKDKKQQLWVLSSTNSRELITARLARMDKTERWLTTEIPDWYLSDVKILSPTQMFACGFTGEKVSRRAVESSEGIIAFSPDGGRSWRIIYKTKNASSINALAIVSSNKVLAVGDNGSIFNISKS